jgi:putative lipoic acid-binding regulatory protein
MNDESNLLEFPCPFPVKAMGRSDGDFKSLVSNIVLRHAELSAGEEVRARASGSGNYTSITITIEATSREQLDNIYQDLTDCEQVLMAL